MDPKGGGGGGGGIDGGSVGQDETFCRRRWRVRFPRSDDLEPFFFYNFAECMRKTKKERALFQRRDINFVKNRIK